MTPDPRGNFHCPNSGSPGAILLRGSVRSLFGWVFVELLFVVLKGTQKDNRSHFGSPLRRTHTHTQRRKKNVRPPAESSGDKASSKGVISAPSVRDALRSPFSIAGPKRLAQSTGPRETRGTGSEGHRRHGNILMDGIPSHYFETMVETIVRWHLQRNRIIPGFPLPYWVCVKIGTPPKMVVVPFISRCNHLGKGNFKQEQNPTTRL